MRVTSRHRMTRTVMIVFLLVMALFLNSPALSSEVIQTATTGQKSCYNEIGTKIACTGTGQDGAFQAGAGWPTARFAADMSGCWIADNLTGIMWARNAKQQCADTWMVAMMYGEALSLCGYTDWRAANINELESLVNAGSANLPSWLSNMGFTNLQSGYYFSSTSYLNDNTNYPSPWSMSVQDGTGTGGPTTSNSILPTKASTACIMLVRGGYNDKSPARVSQTGQTSCYDEFNQVMSSCISTGQDGAYQTGAAWAVTRFNVNGDGTITDQFTKLMWTQDAQTPGPTSDPNIDPLLCVPGEKKTWQDALNYVKYCLNSATTPFLGYRDWRLPNRNELASLLDRSQTSPALPPGHPFLNVIDPSDGTGGHWTSTTYMRTRSNAWIVDMVYGDTEPNPKAGQRALHVWPVRGGYPALTTLTTSSLGPGTGTVTKNPSGADCTEYCDKAALYCCSTAEWPEGAERYPQGKKVTLTAKPAKDSVFVGWSGYTSCGGKAGTCAVTMTDDFVITAAFASHSTISVVPSSAKDFGKISVSKAATANFTIKNNTTNGKADLTISSISLAGDTNFTIPADKNKCVSPYVLKPGKSCTFKVVFSPTATGVLNDTLTVFSDDPLNPAITVSLTGQGL